MTKLVLALCLALLGLAPAQAQVILSPPPGGTAITGCVYNTSPPTLTNGQAGYIQCGSNGEVIISGGGSPYQFTSAGAGQYALAITSAQTLTVPAGSLIAEICVETASARYTTTGTTPSSTVGIPISAGGCFQLAGIADLNAFKIIGAGATMDVEYFK